MSTDEELYAGREQTLVKHFIFGNYLQRLAYIVGFKWSSITYVDGFSGPWNARSSDYRDSSFAIALEELRKAQQTHLSRGKDLKIRCYFIEKELGASSALENFAASQRAPDTEIKTFEGEFQEAIPDIVHFIKGGGPATFPFIFIDPKGWTGYALEKIMPLFVFSRVEIMINFQTRFISRFISLQETRESFQALFGSEDVRERILGLQRSEREEASVNEYCKCLKQAGGFKFVTVAIVLRPESNRTHFHLIYATKHAKGVDVFKDAERKSVPLMHKARADAQSRRRVQRKGQLELLPSKDMYDESYYDSLRNQFCNRAKQDIKAILQQRHSGFYDDIWTVALSHPLVWEQDLREWLKKWQADRLVICEGMKSGQRVPKRGQRIRVVWKR